MEHAAWAWKIDSLNVAATGRWLFVHEQATEIQEVRCLFLGRHEPPLIRLDGMESQSAISCCTRYRMLAVQRDIERPVRDADNLVAGRANGIADLRHPVILLDPRATAQVAGTLGIHCGSRVRP